MEGLASGEDFATGDGDGGGFGEFDISFDVIGREGFFKPSDVVIGEHHRGVACPVEAVGPELFAAAGIDHEFDIASDGAAGGVDEFLVEGGRASAEGAPAEFDGLEAALDGVFEGDLEFFGFVEEDRAIGLDAGAIIAAEESGDGLIAGFSEDVPEGEIEAADGVFHGASPALPEGGLAELFGDAFGFDAGFPFEEGPKELHGTADEGAGSEAGADAGDAFIGVDFDEGVEVFLGFVALGPAAIDSSAGEGEDIDFDDLHGAVSSICEA